jgi:uncharacterized protein YndB with AHSA1/START domain
MKTRIVAERRIDAPADTIYHCLVDYREHHRPEGFLPPAFSDLEIIRGGVGTGTEYRLTMELGGKRRSMVASVTETVPGREIVETSEGLRTTFTLEPEGDGTLVRFETVMESAGVDGIVNRLFAGRLLRPVYADELGRLETYAQAHGQRNAVS